MLSPLKLGLSDGVCRLKQTSPEGKMQEQGLSAPQSLLFPGHNCGQQQALGEGVEETGQVYNNAGHIITLSDPYILHS